MNSLPDPNAIIDAAFANSKYPGDDCLTVYSKAGRDFDETWKLLRGKEWREMPVLEFITGDTPIPDLTPQAFHYYLPALLKASLIEGLSGFVLSSLKFFLNPKYAKSDHPEFGYDSEANHAQFRLLLSAQQLNAIEAAIEEWRSRNGADEEEYAELRRAYASKD